MTIIDRTDTVKADERDENNREEIHQFSPWPSPAALDAHAFIHQWY